MFDLDELKARAEAASYKRGLKLVQSGHVTNLNILQKTAQAIVVGQKRYRVGITKVTSSTAQTLYATCTCPAASYQDICKHAVAVAIKANAESLTSNNSSTLTLSDPVDTLKQWLAGQKIEQLVSYLMSYIEQDSYELDKWIMKASAAEGALPLASVKKLITKALPLRSLWDWPEVSKYFDEACTIVESIIQAMVNFSNEEQWSLMLKCLERLDKVLERIDDSGGYRSNLEELLNDNLVRVFSLLEWSDQKKAQWLYNQIAEPTLEFSLSIPDQFNISSETETLLLDICNQQLLSLRSSLNLNNFDSRYLLSKIANPLITKSKASGNWREQCRVLALIAKKCDDYLEICRICLANKAEFDAEDWLLKAKKNISSPHDERQCAKHEIDVLIALEKPLDAWNIEWAFFERSPSFMRFESLEKLRQKINYAQPDYLNNVETALEQHSVKREDAIYSNTSRECNDVLDFYINQELLDKARIWVKKYAVSREGLTSLIALADKIIKSHPQDAIELYARTVQPTIGRGTNEAYKEATNHLLHLQKLLKKNSHELITFQQLILDLAKKNKPKRNMLKLLKDNFDEYLDK